MHFLRGRILVESSVHSQPSTILKQSTFFKNQTMMRMRYSLSFLLLSLSVFYTTSFTTVSSSPPNSPFSRSQNKKSFLFSSSGDNDDESDKKGPVLVVGATGKVGRLVVKQLLEKGIYTRALVRNEEKARELFLASDDSSSSSSSKLEIITHDIATTNDDEDNNTKLEESIKGCKSVISVVGTMRFSKLTDFLPFPRFLFFKKSLKDITHPYRVNYLAQIQIAELCVKHKVQNVVRLTGLSTGLSAFSFVSIIFSSLLSMTSRYHYCAERDMKQILLSSSNNNENENEKENVNFYVLRPGGLSDEMRNDETTSLQISTDTKSIPPPARVGRADVASLAIELCNSQSNNKKSCVLATRWTGTDIKPKSQGKYQDGFKTAKECVESLDLTDYEFPEYKYKPYVLASGLFVYSFIGLVLKLGWKVISVILSFFR